MRCLAAFLIALPAAAAPLAPGTPQLQLRFEGLFGQPTTLLGARGGGGLGLGWRLTDQLWAIGDAAQRAAPNGGIGSLAVGLQATLDMTPIEPYVELAIVRLTNHDVLGCSLATRTGLGADWVFRKDLALGLVVRTYTPFDPEGDNATLAGLEAALRLVFTPGAK
ncbi:MAG: hypothetical protein ABR567_18675 [Myxococcales bacterium]